MKISINISFALAMLAASLALAAVAPVAAQTYTVLHGFSAENNCPYCTNGDGADPISLILSGSTLYGTTQSGGSGGEGTVFGLKTNGTGFTVLHAFSPISGGCPSCFNADGASPNSLVLLTNTLYGTAQNSGNYGYGTVFSVNTDGTGFTTLYNFSGSDGGQPGGRGPLLQAAGTLYGTTEYGGNGFTPPFGGGGTIFSINTDGTSFTSLYSFSPTSTNSSRTYTNSDGSMPTSLVMCGTSLYGTTGNGGQHGSGTVYGLNTDGTSFTVLHTFAATGSQGQNIDGSGPQALVLSGGTLCGVTVGGGSGYGVLFSINTDGTAFKVLKAFTPSTPIPVSPLVLTGNVLYGRTQSGRMFTINTDGTGLTNVGFNVNLSSFLWSRSTLYGTATGGGSTSNPGAVFALSLPFTSPQLKISPAGANSILTWPASPTIFTLESTANLTPPPVWTAVSPPPVLINGQNTVTNHIAGQRQFYRLSQ